VIDDAGGYRVTWMEVKARHEITESRVQRFSLGKTVVRLQAEFDSKHGRILFGVTQVCMAWMRLALLKWTSVVCGSARARPRTADKIKTRQAGRQNGSLCRMRSDSRLTRASWALADGVPATIQAKGKTLKMSRQPAVRAAFSGRGVQVGMSEKDIDMLDDGLRERLRGLSGRTT